MKNWEKRVIKIDRQIFSSKDIDIHDSGDDLAKIPL